MNVKITSCSWGRRIVALVVICTFLLDSIPFAGEALALAPWLASQTPAVKREISAFCEEYRLVFAGSEEDRSLLSLVDMDVLPRMKEDRLEYLASEELEGDDLKLLRAIIRSEIKTVMKIIQAEDEEKFDSIEQLITSKRAFKTAYYKIHPDNRPKGGRKTPVEDIVAEAFTYMLLSEKGMLAQREMSPDEQAFLALALKVIDSEEGKDLFTGVFREKRIRDIRLRITLANNPDFYLEHGKSDDEEAFEDSEGSTMALEAELREVGHILWRAFIGVKMMFEGVREETFLENLGEFLKGDAQKDILRGHELKELVESRRVKRDAVDRKTGLEQLENRITDELEDDEYVVVNITGRSGSGKTTISNAIGAGIDDIASSEIMVLHSDFFYNNTVAVNELIRKRDILNIPLEELSQQQFEELEDVASRIRMPWPSAHEGKSTFLNYYNRYKEKQAAFGTTDIVIHEKLRNLPDVSTPLEDLDKPAFNAIAKAARAFGIDRKKLKENMARSLWEIYLDIEVDEFLKMVESDPPACSAVRLFVVEGTYSYQGQEIFNTEAERLMSDINVFIEVDEATREDRIRRRARPGWREELLEMGLLDVVYASTLDRERAAADIVLDNNRETNEYQIVTTSNGRKIQFGIPAETTRFLKGRESAGAGVPEVFVLPHELFHAGRSYADVELIPFAQKGKRITLVGTPSQIDDLKIFLQQSMFGPDHSGQEFLSYDEDTQRFLRTMRDLYAKRGKDGHILSIEEHVDLVAFENGKAVVDRSGDRIEIIHKGLNTFSVIETGKDVGEKTVEVDYRAPAPALPDKDLPVLKVPPQRFAVTPLGTSHGFDPEGSYTSFIIWLEGEGIMVDPSPEALDHITSQGIDEDIMPYVFLTHTHADHDGGLLRKILMKRRVKLIASRPVYDSFIAKAQVLVGHYFDVRRWIDYIEVKPGEGNELKLPLSNGEEAEIAVRYNLHSIPTNGFKISYRGKSFGYSGDTAYDTEKIDELEIEKKISSEQARDLKYFFWDEEEKPEVDLLFHEASRPPVHTPLSTLSKLSPDVRERMRLVHIADKDVPEETGIEKAGVFETYVLIESDEKSRYETLVKPLDVASMVITNLTPEKRWRIVREGKQETYASGDEIIREGDPVGPDSRFYIVISGLVDVVKGGEKVWQLGPGDVFGEMALEFDIPRTASIIAQGDVNVLSLDRAQYDALISDPDFREEVQRYMEDLDLFERWVRNTSKEPCASLSTYALKHLCNRRKIRTYEPGAVIVREGEKGDEFFIIRSGSVKVYKDVEGSSKLLARLVPGDHFGEMALLSADMLRTATVEAESALEVSVLSKADFDNILHEFPGIDFSVRKLAERRKMEAAEHAEKPLKEPSVPISQVFPMPRARFEDRSFIISDELEKIIQTALGKYNIARVDDLYILKFGKIKDSIQVVLVQTADGGLYVLKIDRNRSAESLDVERQWVRYLEDNGFPFAVPMPLRAADGSSVVEHGENSFILYPYLAYESGVNETPDADSLHVLGQMIAEYHRCIEGFEKATSGYSQAVKERSYFLDFQDIDKNLSALSRKREKFDMWRSKGDENGARSWFLDDDNWDFLSGQMNLLKEALAGVYDKLPKTFVHGDLHPGNILYSGERIRALIDPDLFRMEARIYDLAGAIYQIMRSAEEEDPVLMWSELVASYQASLPAGDVLSPEEVSHIQDIAKAGLIYHYLYLAKGLMDLDERLYINTEEGARRCVEQLDKIRLILERTGAYDGWKDIKERLTRTGVAKEAVIGELSEMISEGYDPLLIAPDLLSQRILGKRQDISREDLGFAYRNIIDIRIHTSLNEVEELFFQAKEISSTEPAKAYRMFAEAADLCERTAVASRYESPIIELFHRIERTMEKHRALFSDLLGQENPNQVFLIATQDRPQGLSVLLESLYRELKSFDYNRHPGSGKVLIVVVDDSNNIHDNNYIKNQDIINRTRAKLLELSENYDIRYWGPYEQQREQRRISGEVYGGRFDPRRFLYADDKSLEDGKKSYGRIRNICIDAVCAETSGMEGPTYVTWLDDDNVMGTHIVNRSGHLERRHVFNYIRKLHETFERTGSKIITADYTYDGIDGLFGLSTLKDLPDLFGQMADNLPSDLYPLYPDILSRSKIRTGAFDESSSLRLIAGASTKKQLYTYRDYFLELLRSIPFVLYGRYPYRLKAYHPDNMTAPRDDRLISSGKMAVGGGGNTTFELGALKEVPPFFTFLTRGEDIANMLLSIGLYGDKVQRINNNTPVIHRRLAGQRMDLAREIKTFYESFIMVGILNWMIAKASGTIDEGGSFTSGNMILNCPHASKLTPDKIKEMLSLHQEVPEKVLLGIENEVYGLVMEQIDSAREAVSELRSSGYLEAGAEEFWWGRDLEVKDAMAGAVRALSAIESGEYVRGIEAIHESFGEGKRPEFIGSAMASFRSYADNLDEWYLKMRSTEDAMSGEKRIAQEPGGKDDITISPREWLALAVYYQESTAGDARSPDAKKTTEEVKSILSEKDEHKVKEDLFILTHGQVEIVEEGGRTAILYAGDLLGPEDIDAIRRKDTSMWYDDNVEWVHLTDEAYSMYMNDPSISGLIAIMQQRVRMLEEWLQKTTFGGLKEISLRGIKHLAVSSQELKVRKDEAIVREGESGNEFYIITSGSVRVEGRQEGVIARLAPGDYFGEMALLSEDHLRKASVIADEDSRMLVFSGALFNNLLREFPLVESTLSEVSHRRSLPGSVISSFSLSEDLPNSLDFLKDPRNLPRLGFTFLSECGGVLWVAGKAFLVNPTREVIEKTENIGLEGTKIGGYFLTVGMSDEDMKFFNEHAYKQPQRPVFVTEVSAASLSEAVREDLTIRVLDPERPGIINLPLAVWPFIKIDTVEDCLVVTYQGSDIAVPLKPAYSASQINETDIVLRADEEQWEHFISEVCGIVASLSSLDTEASRAAIARGSIHYCRPGDRILEEGTFVSTQEKDRGGDTDILHSDERYHIILDGTVVVMSGTGPLAEIGQGGDLGSWSLEKGEPPSATVEAGREGAWILSLTGEAYHNIISTPQTREAVKRILDNLLFFQKVAQYYDWMRDLPEATKLSLAVAAQPQVFLPGQEIVKEDEEGRSMYFVKDGLVEVNKRTSADKSDLIGSFSEGYYFGEMALMTGDPRTATITAVTRTEVLAIDQEAFDAILNVFPFVRQQLRNVAALRKQGLDRRVYEKFDYDENLKLRIDGVKALMGYLSIPYPRDEYSEEYLEGLLIILEKNIPGLEKQVKWPLAGSLLSNILLDIDRKKLHDRDGRALRALVRILVRVNPYELSLSASHFSDAGRLRSILKYLFTDMDDERLGNVALLGFKGGRSIGGLHPALYRQVVDLLSEDFTVIDSSPKKESTENLFRRWGQRFTATFVEHHMQTIIQNEQGAFSPEVIQKTREIQDTVAETGEMPLEEFYRWFEQVKKEDPNNRAVREVRFILEEYYGNDFASALLIRRKDRSEILEKYWGLSLEEAVPVLNKLIKTQDEKYVLEDESDIYRIPEPLFIKIAVVSRLREIVLGEMYGDGVLVAGSKDLQRRLGLDQSYITFLANAIHSPQTAEEFSVEIDLLNLDDLRRFVFGLIEERDLSQQLDTISSFLAQIKNGVAEDKYDHLVFSPLNPFRVEKSRVFVADASHHGLGDSLMKAPFVWGLVANGAEAVDVLAKFQFAYKAIEKVNRFDMSRISPLLKDGETVKRMYSDRLSQEEEEILISDFMKYFDEEEPYQYYFTIPASNFLTKVVLAMAKRSKAKAIIMLKDRLHSRSEFVQVDFTEPKTRVHVLRNEYWVDDSVFVQNIHDRAFMPSNKSSQYLSLFKQFGFEELEPMTVYPDRHVLEKVKDMLADMYVPIDRQMVLINPFTAFQYKQADCTTWAEYIKELSTLRSTVFLISGGTSPQEYEFARSIARESGGESVIVLPRMSLEEFNSIIYLSDLYIGHDTGTSHIAGALNKPNIIVFGPTPPERFLPLCPVSLGIGTLDRSEIIPAFKRLISEEPHEFGVSSAAGAPSPRIIAQAARLLLWTAGADIEEEVRFAPEARRTMFIIKRDMKDFLGAEGFVEGFIIWNRIKRNLEKLSGLLPHEVAELFKKENQDFSAGMDELISRERDLDLLKMFLSSSNMMKILDFMDTLSRSRLKDNELLEKKLGKTYAGALFDFDLTLFDEKEGRVRRGIIDKIIKRLSLGEEIGISTGRPDFDVVYRHLVRFVPWEDRRHLTVYLSNGTVVRDGFGRKLYSAAFSGFMINEMKYLLRVFLPDSVHFEKGHEGVTMQFSSDEEVSKYMPAIRYALKSVSSDADAVHFREGGVILVKEDADKLMSLEHFRELLGSKLKREVTVKDILVVGDSDVDLSMINASDGILLSEEVLPGLSESAAVTPGDLAAAEYILGNMSLSKTGKDAHDKDIELLLSLLDEYRIKGIKEILYLKDGVVKIVTEKKAYILKETRLDEKTWGSIDEVMRYLRMEGYPSTMIVRNTARGCVTEKNGTRHILMEFVRGRAYGEYSWLQDSEIAEAAAGLARWHEILSGMGVGDVRIPSVGADGVCDLDFKDILGGITGWKDTGLSRPREELLRTIKNAQSALNRNMTARRYADLPDAIINGDFQKANIAYDHDGKFRGVFDPEFVRVEKRVWDVTRALISFAGNYENPERLLEDKSLVFLKAFSEQQPLYAEEIRLIPDVYLSMIIYILHDDFSKLLDGKSHKRGFIEKINRYIRTLEKMNEIDWDSWADMLVDKLEAKDLFDTRTVRYMKIDNELDLLDIRNVFFEEASKGGRLMLEIEGCDYKYEVLELLGEGRKHRGVVFTVVETATKKWSKRYLCLKVSARNLGDEEAMRDELADRVGGDPDVLDYFPKFYGHMGGLKNTILMDAGVGPTAEDHFRGRAHQCIPEVLGYCARVSRIVGKWHSEHRLMHTNLMNGKNQILRYGSNPFFVDLGSTFYPERFGVDLNEEHFLPDVDIYGMGVLLYEMFQGYSKIVDRSLIFKEYAMVTRIKGAGFPIKKRNAPLHEVNPNVPPALSKLIMKAMFEDPDGEKFSSMEELALALEALIEDPGAEGGTIIPVDPEDEGAPLEGVKASRPSETMDEVEVSGLTKQSLILYADDLLENAAAQDLEETVRDMLGSNGILEGGKVVLYARNIANAAVLKRLIKRADDPVEIIIVTEEHLKESRNMAEYDEVQEIGALIKIARARGAEDILAIIKGPTERPWSTVNILRNVAVPMVVLGYETGLYSFADAVKAGIRTKESKGSKGWLTMLDPDPGMQDMSSRDTREFLKDPSFERFRRYSGMDKDKFVKILQEKLKRDLTPSETEKAEKLMDLFEKIRDDVRPSEQLNDMLCKGGRPNLCMLMNAKASAELQEMEVPHFQMTTMCFMHYKNEFSTFYPYDERIRHFWWDFDEGDHPVHVFMVFNYLGVPFVLDLSADQFMKALGNGVQGEFLDIGAVIIPTEDLEEYDWPYVGGRVLNKFARKALSGIIRVEDDITDLMTKENNDERDEPRSDYIKYRIDMTGKVISNTVDDTDEEAMTEAGIEAARGFLDEVKRRAEEAGQRGEKIVVGIDTSWIPRMQRSLVQGLVNRLTYLSTLPGLDNIIIERANGDALAGKLHERLRSTGTPLSNVIILGSEEVLDGEGFDPLKGLQGSDTGAFFAKVSMPEEAPVCCDIRLLEILTMSLRLAFDPSVSLENTFVDIRPAGQDGTRTFYFIPKPGKIEFEELIKSYRNQERLLTAA